MHKYIKYKIKYLVLKSFKENEKNEKNEENNQLVNELVKLYMEEHNDMNISIEEKEELFNKYNTYEQHFDEIKQKITEVINSIPLSSIYGGINYLMTYEEMHNFIKHKIIELYKKGIIVSELKDIDDWYYTRENLTRFWGAQYLENQFNNNKNIFDNFRVPEFKIVIPDFTNINVIVRMTDFLPMIYTFDKCKIYTRKIYGRPCAHTIDFVTKSELASIHYMDFADKGNIICTKTNYYIVDTELKSFTFYENVLKKKEMKNKKTIIDLFDNYLKQRFTIIYSSCINYFDLNFLISMNDV